MPSVLGIVGSNRRNGNSEMMMRVALEGAAAGGAEIEILRLGDFVIKPCTGCMTCVFKNQPCPQQDDAEFVLRKLLSADGVLFAAPVYFLSPAGAVKMLVDRMFMIEYLAPHRSPRPAAMIVTLSSQRDWIGFSVPLLASYLLFSGFHLTDALVSSAPGPGEILLNSQSVERARQIGAGLLSAERQPTAEDTCCPLCFGEAFELHGDGEVECPICWVKGRVIGRQDGKALIRFNADWTEKHRFTAESWREHLESWIRGSKQEFAIKLQAIREARQAFKDQPINWVKPPR